MEGIFSREGLYAHLPLKILVNLTIQKFPHILSVVFDADQNSVIS